VESIAKQRRWGARRGGGSHTGVLPMETKAGFLPGPMHSRGDLRQARVCPPHPPLVLKFSDPWDFGKQQLKSLDGEESGQNSQASLERVLLES